MGVYYLRCLSSCWSHSSGDSVASGIVPSHHLILPGSPSPPVPVSTSRRYTSMNKIPCCCWSVCFTSTETVGLLGTGAQDVHLDFHTVPELWRSLLYVCAISVLGPVNAPFIVQELCESRGGRPGLSVLTCLLVSVDVKNYWTVLRHWSQLVPNMSTDIWGH